MKNYLYREDIRRGRSTRYFTAAVTGLAAMAVSGIGGAAFADEPPVAMAPPVATTSAPSTGGDVFQWTEIPQNQQVPLTRAVFDQGGYQLFDTAGETIVVPFANQNLYVMKFAVSPNNTLYFVNENGTPVLYVPRNGSLENAAVPGAKWYPFSEQFAPTQPVFLGIAPSYTEFVDLGWYPDMVIHGGYYGATSFLAGGVFLPTLGLTFVIGGHPYHDWHDYHHYVIVHPAPYRIGYVNHYAYHGFRPYHEFHGHTGYHSNAGYHGFPTAGGHVFHGFTGHPTDSFRYNGVHPDYHGGAPTHIFHGAFPGGNGGGHIYSGGNHLNAPASFSAHGAADHTFHGMGPHAIGGDHPFHGTEPRGTGGDHAFYGAGSQMHEGGAGFHGDGGHRH